MKTRANVAARTHMGQWAFAVPGTSCSPESIGKNVFRPSVVQMTTFPKAEPANGEPGAAEGEQQKAEAMILPIKAIIAIQPKAVRYVLSSPIDKYYSPRSDGVKWLKCLNSLNPLGERPAVEAIAGLTRLPFFCIQLNICS